MQLRKHRVYGSIICHLQVKQFYLACVHTSVLSGTTFLLLANSAPIAE
jgi:hypothetical protein